jgi:hypothetical protein
VCLDLGCLRHLHRRSAVVAGVVPVGQWSRADATQARSVIVTKRIVARTVCVEVFVVAFACAAATAVFVWLGCVVGRSVGVRAAWRLMQAEFLLLVVGLVANSRRPRLIRIETTACAATSLRAVVCALVGTSSGTVVSVLELENLGINPAFDASGCRARVIGRAAARGFKGRDGVHGRWRETILLGIELGIEVPSEVGARYEQEQDNEEDPAAVHRVGRERVGVWVRLGVRMREDACKARMGEPDLAVGATLGAEGAENL